MKKVINSLRDTSQKESLKLKAAIDKIQRASLARSVASKEAFEEVTKFFKDRIDLLEAQVENLAAIKPSRQDINREIIELLYLANEELHDQRFTQLLCNLQVSESTKINSEYLDTINYGEESSITMLKVQEALTKLREANVR